MPKHSDEDAKRAMDSIVKRKLDYEEQVSGHERGTEDDARRLAVEIAQRERRREQDKK